MKKPLMPLEGSVFMAGAIVQWLRDGLGIIQNSREVEQLACQVQDTDGVVLVPALPDSVHRIGTVMPVPCSAACPVEPIKPILPVQLWSRLPFRSPMS